VLRYRQAFQQALPAAQQLAVKELIPINIDLPTTVTTTLGALPEILALRDRAKALPEFDVQHLDNLETYALAAMHAHGDYIAASAPPEALLALSEQATALRDTLYSDALALSNRGLISGEKLPDMKSVIGYKLLATDLIALSSLLRRSWDKISTKTAVTMNELDRAEILSDQLMSAVGTREQAPAVVAEVIQQRQRMLTLLVKSYDQARRAITFLRWNEDDLETIAPSLYAGRTGHKKADPGTAAPPTPPTTAPATSNSANGAPATGNGANGAPATSSPVAVGLPGSAPFSS